MKIKHLSHFGNDPSLSQSRSEFVPGLDDLPIACCKGVKTCTKHPISSFVSYEHLSPSFVAFTSQMDSIEIPKSVHEALKVPK